MIFQFFCSRRHFSKEAGLKVSIFENLNNTFVFVEIFRGQCALKTFIVKMPAYCTLCIVCLSKQPGEWHSSSSFKVGSKSLKETKSLLKSGQKNFAKQFWEKEQHCYSKWKSIKYGQFCFVSEKVTLLLLWFQFTKYGEVIFHQDNDQT